MPRLRLFPVRSGRIIASVGKNGWLAMRALQRLARSPSSCSASPKPSQPSSACRQLSMSHVPSDRGLLCSERPASPLRRERYGFFSFPRDACHKREGLFLCQEGEKGRKLSCFQSKVERKIPYFSKRRC